MKKILLFLLMVFPFMVGACSCDNFSLSTYESASKNFKDSTGYEYELVVTTEIDGQSYYTRDEYKNKYILKTTGEVYNFSSELKSYNVSNPTSTSPSGSYSLAYTLHRYYVGEQEKFYTKVKEGNTPEVKAVEDISYDAKYSDDNDKYNTKNLVPCFTKDQLTGFQISNASGKDGYSTAIFTAPVLSYLESDEDVTLYTVTIDKNAYFNEITFVVVKGAKTTTYEYKFLKFNSNVNIEFPADLANY